MTDKKIKFSRVGDELDIKGFLLVLMLHIHTYVKQTIQVKRKIPKELARPSMVSSLF